MTETQARRGRPANPERQALIADAIVALLAEAGARGLTHRAVDLRAGLPPGTTSYHAPARVDLMVLASRRITELGLAELDWLIALIKRNAPLTTGQVIAPLLATWRERLRSDQRDRARAEIAVALASSRNPVVGAAYTAPKVFVEIWTEVMRRLGARNPSAAAAEFTSTIRGRFYQHVLSNASLDDNGLLNATLSAVLKTLVEFDSIGQAVTVAECKEVDRKLRGRQN